MRNILLISFFSLAFLIACDDADTYDVREDALINYKADINGEWSLFSIERGASDLSGVFGTNLKLTLGSDGTFTLSDAKMPFPTLKTTVTDFSTGNWSFDDDYQPTKIQFTNGTDVVPVNILFPLYGKNNTSLGLEFSLGCSSVIYKYHFKK